MQLSPLKLGLIVVGSIIVGIAMAIVAFVAWMYVQATSDTPTGFSLSRMPKQKTVASVSHELSEPRYLGTSNMTWGDRPHLTESLVLEEGNARIVGSAMVEGRPLAGLRLRLSLNRKAHSAWAITDQNGRYEIRVPPGRYEVSGFELDSQTADKLLAGMILQPEARGFDLRDMPMDVTADRAGKGMAFKFVSPVVVTEPVGEVASGTRVVFRWQPYPGAVTYRVQLNETPSRNHVGSVNQVFSWRNRPQVNETSLDVASAGVALKPGHYYSIQVDALDERGAVISENASSYRLSQFQILETGK